MRHSLLALALLSALAACQKTEAPAEAPAAAPAATAAEEAKE